MDGRTTRCGRITGKRWPPMSPLGQSRQNSAFAFESALTSTSDVSLHRTKRRFGPGSDIAMHKSSDRSEVRLVTPGLDRQACHQGSVLSNRST